MPPRGHVKWYYEVEGDACLGAYLPAVYPRSQFPWSYTSVSMSDVHRGDPPSSPPPRLRPGGVNDSPPKLNGRPNITPFLLTRWDRPLTFVAYALGPRRAPGRRRRHSARTSDRSGRGATARRSGGGPSSRSDRDMRELRCLQRGTRLC